MASITSLSNSSYSTNSIYGNRNILSGLASGMDTESMIENAVSGIKLKIQNLQKRRTKVEWQQEAYRSIIDKAVNLSNKYTSYSSKTNLLSSSFFNSAVNTTTTGTYKDKISATGKTSSSIKIDAVRQLAEAATYTVSGLGGLNTGEISTIDGGQFDVSKTDMQVSTVSGTLNFKYGGNNGASFEIKFGELEDINDVKVYNEDGTEKTDASDAEKMAQAIRNKLSEVTYNYTKNGFNESTTADKAIKVEVNDDGVISFSDGLGSGNKVSISSASGAIKDTLRIGKDAGSIKVDKKLTKEMSMQDFLSDKSLGFTFNGTSKTISMEKVVDQITGDTPEAKNASFVKALQKELDNAFGAGKISVGQKDGGLSFSTDEGSTLALGGSAVEALGFTSGDSNYINAGKKLTDLLGGADSKFFTENRLKGTFNSADGKPTEKVNGNGTKYYVDDKGNRVDEDGFRITSEGKAMYDFQVNGAHINVTEDTTLESLVNSINSNAEAGVKVSYSKLTNEFKFTTTETGANSKIEFGGMGKDLFGDTSAAGRKVDTTQKVSELLGDDYAGYGSNAFSVDLGFGSFSVSMNENSTIDSIVGDVNQMMQDITTYDPVDGAKFKDLEASFDSKTNSLVFKNKTTGETVDATLGSGAAQDLFGKIQVPENTGKFTAGKDAVMDVTINGKKFENFTRSSNTFDIDGLNVTVKGEFTTKDDEEGVTFSTTTDSDKIVDAIRSFVEDYNEMATEIKNAYSTMPATKTNKARYEPLTAEQEEGMTESEIKAYNEKAKQGILFGDSTLSSMYGKLLSAITPGGEDGQTLREIGINTSYNNGMTTLSLDEDKLRAALEGDPDKVRTAFTKTKEGGSSSDGLMMTMQNTLNTYVKTAGEPKGVLITKAGSVKAPTSLNSNSLQSQIDSIDKQIDRWQDKMSSQIDRYTTQFSRLEQLIAEMNSQASAMSGLMGGASGY